MNFGVPLPTDMMDDRNRNRGDASMETFKIYYSGIIEKGDVGLCV